MTISAWRQFEVVDLPWKEPMRVFDVTGTGDTEEWLIRSGDDSCLYREMSNRVGRQQTG